MSKLGLQIIGFIMWTILVWLWSGAAWYNEGLKDERKEDERDRSL